MTTGLETQTVAATSDTTRRMTPAEVIEALTFIAQGQSPRAALEAALTMPDELTPRLLEVLALAPVDLEKLDQSTPDEQTAFYLHDLAFYLLAAYREPRAWPLMLDYFVSDADLSDELSGDALTGDLSGMLVRCYDGSDLSYLERLIETPALNVFFRNNCLLAYHGLVLTGKAQRDRFIAFIERQLDAPDAEQDEWYDWLALTAAHVREPHLQAKIETLFDRGLIANQGFMRVLGREEVAAIYAEKTNTHYVDCDILSRDLFDDFVDSICRWYWFQPVTPPKVVKPGDYQRFATEVISRYVPPQNVRDQPKIGRNETCHCGSGKKYKKCCLDEDRGLDS